MRRDVQEGKPRFDLIYYPMIKRLAGLMERGATKYGENNWQKANSVEELIRFKSSMMRHAFQFWNNENAEEDHGAAILFNLGAMMYLMDKLDITDVSISNLYKLLEQEQQH
jgi:hypothetical protein